MLSDDILKHRNLDKKTTSKSIKWAPPMGPSEGKSLEIDTVSQNRLNVIEKS